MELSGKRSDFTEAGTAHELKKFCELCEAENITTIANGICRECEEFMCSTCFRHHLKGKLYRQHVLVDTDQSVTPEQRSFEKVEKCKRHSNETIKFYCRKHETVGCGECMIPEHSVCQPENIKDLSKGFQQNENFKSLMTKLENIMSANKENDKKVQQSKKANTDMLDKSLKEIKSFRAEINNYLDRAEESIIKQAKDSERENSKLLAKLAEDCTQLSSRIMEVRQKLDAEIYQDSALFIHTADCKPIVLDIERDVARIQRENYISALEFIPDKQLQGIITATLNLGSITKRTKPDTTTETKAVGNKVATDGNKHTGKKEEELRPATRVVVGARVRPTGTYFEWGHGIHNYQPGTVTAVNYDGSVDVKWDANFETLGCYTIGVHVQLI